MSTPKINVTVLSGVKWLSKDIQLLHCRHFLVTKFCFVFSLYFTLLSTSVSTPPLPSFETYICLLSSLTISIPFNLSIYPHSLSLSLPNPLFLNSEPKHKF